MTIDRVPTQLLLTGGEEPVLFIQPESDHTMARIAGSALFPDILRYLRSGADCRPDTRDFRNPDAMVNSMERTLSQVRAFVESTGFWTREALWRGGNDQVEVALDNMAKHGTIVKVTRELATTKGGKPEQFHTYRVPTESEIQAAEAQKQERANRARIQAAGKRYGAGHIETVAPK